MLCVKKDFKPLPSSIEPPKRPAWLISSTILTKMQTRSKRAFHVLLSCLLGKARVMYNQTHLLPLARGFATVIKKTKQTNKLYADLLLTPDLSHLFFVRNMFKVLIHMNKLLGHNLE